MLPVTASSTHSCGLARHIYNEPAFLRKVPWLANYSVSIPPGGRTDALVQAVITWNWNGKVYRTRGLDADQTEAAIKATVKLLNLIEGDYKDLESHV